MMSDQRGQRGFTLVEMIIAMTIFAFLFTVISYIQSRGELNVPQI
jgi:prepilin-type N-terminal cleavage/methylation domain-containing protein